MKIILLQDVKSLGKKGEIVDVSDGYARNFIFPKKFGVEANAKNLNDLKLQKANDEKVAAENLAKAQELSGKLKDRKVVVKLKAGEGGKTFGSVSSKEIAEVIAWQLETGHGWDIGRQSVTGTGDSQQTFSMKGMDLYVMWPDEESVSEASRKINELLEE